MTVSEPDVLGALCVDGTTNFGSGTGTDTSLRTGCTNTGTTTTSGAPTQTTPGPTAKNGCRTKPRGTRNRDDTPRCGGTKMVLGARNPPPSPIPTRPSA